MGGLGNDAARVLHISARRERRGTGQACANMERGPFFIHCQALHMNETKPVIRALNEQDADAFHAMRLYATENYPAGIVPTYEEESKLTPEERKARVRATEHQVVFGAFVGD